MTSTFRARILSAGLWTAGGFAAQKAFQLGSNLVLTRLLYPEAFGMMALANVVLIGLQMFSDVGIKPAIIQSPRGEEEEFLNTGWTIQVVRGFILWGVSCLIAYPASLLYDNAVLFPLICCLGATAAINGFASIALATSEKRLMVRRLTVVQLAGQVASLTITALMAWWLKSVWALAYGGIAGAVIGTTFSHLFMPPHRHRFIWKSDAVDSLVRFGRWIFVSTAITFIGGQGLRALQGIFITPAQLGIVTLAQTLAMMPSELAGQMANLVGFPALAEVRRQGTEALLAALTTMRKKLLLFALPVFFGLALVSGPLIDLMYDDRYAAAGHYLAILALVGSLGIVPLGYYSAILAEGDTRLHFFCLALTMAARVAAMIAGFQIASVEGMLIGIGVGELTGYIFITRGARRFRFVTYGIDSLAFLLIGCAALVTWFVYA